MSLTEKTNHVTEALGNLIEQFKDKPIIAALLESWVEQLQDLETAIFTSEAAMRLDNAEGEQLDGLGAIVGEAREGRTDLFYRAAIAARISLNLSTATLEEIRALIRAVAGTVTVDFTEQFPAAFIAEIEEDIDPATVDPSQIGAIVRSARGAAIESQVIIHVAGPFQYDTGLGYDEGKWAAVF